jgi:hypothetical protein
MYLIIINAALNGNLIESPAEPTTKWIQLFFDLFAALPAGSVSSGFGSFQSALIIRVKGA